MGARSSADLYEELENTVHAGLINKDINVLLLGPSGVGKSSFINSMLMAIDRDKTKCHEYAMTGNYGPGGSRDRGAVTKSLRHFSVKECCSTYSLKPRVNLWDFPGLPDSNDDITAAIIKLLLDGCLDANTPYQDLQKMGLNGLQTLTKNQEEERVINVVAYVHAANDTVQENLLETAEELVRDPSRDLPIFLVITKADLAQKDSHAKKFLRDTMERIIPALGLYGCDEKVFYIKNYCSATTKKMQRSESIDRGLLKLWLFLLDPAYTRQRLPVPNLRRN